VFLKLAESEFDYKIYESKSNPNDFTALLSTLNPEIDTLEEEKFQ
jgi:hypothetical protein